MLKDPKDRRALRKSPTYEEDGQFAKHYEFLKQTREFRGRPELHHKHELKEKLMVLQKIETTLHRKLDPQELLGPTRSGKATYYDAIQPISKTRPPVDLAILKMPFASKPINPFLPDGKERREKVQAAKAAKRDSMVHSYRDRLHTRFQV